MSGRASRTSNISPEHRAMIYKAFCAKLARAEWESLSATEQDALEHGNVIKTLRERELFDEDGRPTPWGNAVLAERDR